MLTTRLFTLSCCEFICRYLLAASRRASGGGDARAVIDRSAGMHQCPHSHKRTNSNASISMNSRSVLNFLVLIIAHVCIHNVLSALIRARMAVCPTRCFRAITCRWACTLRSTRLKLRERWWRMMSDFEFSALPHCIFSENSHNYFLYCNCADNINTFACARRRH
jgi:hypothetical protein